MAARAATGRPEDRELVLSRVFDAPPWLVFEAWSSVKHLARWFCPSGFTVPDCVCEFRVGGRFEVCMRSSDGKDHWSRGRYTEIVRLERIAFDSTVSVDDGDPLYGTDTRVAFVAAGDETRLEVRQVLTLFEPSAAWMVDAVEPGWRDGLGKLEALITRMKEQTA